MRRFALILSIAVAVAASTLAQDPQVDPIILVPEVINVYPHDGNAFTQGLFWHEGKLYESTGLYGRSSLREVDLTTGTVLRQVDVTQAANQLNGDNTYRDYFAEGLTLVGDQLIQLTWTQGEAFVYDLATFERTGTFTYTGEGWGICYDGKQLYMSDSTSYLDLRDPLTFDLLVSFAVLRQVRDSNGNPFMVTIGGRLLNELECVGDSIYANLWQRDLIAKIDKHNGVITAFIDASGLLTEEETAAAEARDAGATLNGIAYNPTTDTFYITGKSWDKLFEVRFVPRLGG